MRLEGKIVREGMLEKCRIGRNNVSFYRRCAAGTRPYMHIYTYIHNTHRLYAARIYKGVHRSSRGDRCNKTRGARVSARCSWTNYRWRIDVVTGAVNTRLHETFVDRRCIIETPSPSRLLPFRRLGWIIPGVCSRRVVCRFISRLLRWKRPVFGDYIQFSALVIILNWSSWEIVGFARPRE